MLLGIVVCLCLFQAIALPRQVARYFAGLALLLDGDIGGEKKTVFLCALWASLYPLIPEPRVLSDGLCLALLREGLTLGLT